MPLTLAEFHIRKRLQRRSVILLFDAACLLGWTSIRAIAELAGVKYDHARVELGKLVEAGWLIREDRGPAKRGQVRYRSPVIGVTDRHTDHPRSVTPITGDRYSLEGSRARPDPDLSGSEIQDQHVRPSGGVQGGTDGRTDSGKLAGHRNELTARVCREWARWAVTPPVAYGGIDRLLNARLTERELQKFLVDALNGKHPAFVGVQDHMRWGQSTSEERIKLWCNIERATRDVGLVRPRRVRERDPTREERATAAAQAEERFKRLTNRRR